MTPERFRRLQEVLSRRQPDFTVLMERVHKVHNFSAIVRTCDAVGILEAHAVIPKHGLPELDSQGTNATSSGAQKWVGLRTYPDSPLAIQDLKARGFRLYAAHFSPRAIDYRQADFTQPCCVVLGTEKWGIGPQIAEAADEHILIPMMGMVQSLNVSVAAATILFEGQRQRLQAGLYQQPRLSSERYQQLLFEWAYPDWAERFRQEGRTYPALDEHGHFSV